MFYKQSICGGLSTAARANKIPEVNPCQLNENITHCHRVEPLAAKPANTTRRQWGRSKIAKEAQIYQIKSYLEPAEFYGS